MKQKIILCFTAFCLFGYTQAQISKESYVKAVDLLNCKTIELTLPKEKIQKYQETCSCQETKFSEIHNFLVTAGKLDASISLCNEIESLKNSYKENWKKEDIVVFLTQSIFKDKKYLKIIAFNDKRISEPDYDKYKSNLKTELIKTLNERDSPETTTAKKSNITPPYLEEKNSEPESKINVEKEELGILGWFADYLILFSFVLNLIALFLIFKKQSKFDNELTNEFKSYVKKKISEAFFDKSGIISNSSSKEMNDAFIRIKELEFEIGKLKSELKTNSSELNSINKESIQHTKEAEIKSETFFLSTPNSDSSFNESSISLTYRDGASIYRFTKIENNRAKFQIDEKEASSKLALQFPDKNIEPVCEAINAFNPKATRISNIELGEAALQNGKWIVNKKAKIKYDN